MIQCAHQSLDNHNNHFLLRKWGEKLQTTFFLLFFMGGEFVFKLKTEKKHFKRQK